MKVWKGSDIVCRCSAEVESTKGLVGVTRTGAVTAATAGCHIRSVHIVVYGRAVSRGRVT